MPQNVPKQLNDLIQECWKREPSQRPAIGQVLEKLVNIRGGAQSFGSINESG